MKMLLPLFLLVLSSFAFGQSDLPDIGKLDDIKGRTKVYVIADGDSRKAMLKKLGEAKLTIADKSDDAEFFMEYRTLSRQPFGILPGATTETGQIDVFIYREKKKVVVWSDSKTGGGFKGDTANQIIARFIKAFKKVS